ncbi:methyltransferase domain-containing protein [Mycena belliarum]|uniref:Methyltransferase domain-containing protein n=1 Tax=Mycena belliarum TaxID=1033014 RepID=A0AAD6TVV7_9AGAR|nr:methyltransferase domain-containing protein [Mycena belliae]
MNDLDLDAARALLASPLVAALLYTHPNDLAGARVRGAWPFCAAWWAWAADANPDSDSTQHWQPESRWEQLLAYYTAAPDLRQRSDKDKEGDIPAEFRMLIDQVRALALRREPVAIAAAVPPLEISARGMSPKKAHEVTRSVAYIANLLDALGVDPRGVRIVDIGAGQGYLTRALQTHLGTRHLLALDSSEIQTRGAQRWEARTRAPRGITQKTVHITPASLCRAIDEWIHESDSPQAENGLGAGPGAGAAPAPVLLVALHACGSLTPDLLRAFLMQRRAALGSQNHLLWTPVGMIAVGCCYNLLAPQDFPLSEAMAASPPLSLPTSAYHMAAQMPAQWFRTPESRADATLALRKVVWRAVIGARFAKTLAADSDEQAAKDGTGDRPVMRRLGRLNNTAYADWATFARAAGARIGVDFAPGDALDAAEQRLVSELEVLHVLRCIVGPLVESVIIADRAQWVREQLRLDGDGDGADDMRVEVVNLFDQATGSGRNVALVVAPAR